MNHLIIKSYNQMKQAQTCDPSLIQKIQEKYSKTENTIKQHTPAPTQDEIAEWSEELVDEIIFFLTDLTDDL